MQTALYKRHIDLEAKMVDFFGWQMPLRYSKGTIAEYTAVRRESGLFDVSHMGVIEVEGLQAGEFLDYLSTSCVHSMKPYTSIYTLWCNENGFILDDVIIFKKSEYSFFVIVNASNRQKDLDHLLNYAKHFDVFVTPRFEGMGIIALQGPKSRQFLEGPLKRFTFMEKGPLIISATGYTGEDGFEIIGPDTHIDNLFNELISQGVMPAGLGARDLLRLEKGYALYGHELSDSIKPLESVSAFTVKKTVGFLGCKDLKEINHRFIAMTFEEGIARENTKLFMDDKEVGKVTSGSFSPILNKAIALGLVSKEAYPFAVNKLYAQVRDKKIKAKVSQVPFL